MPNLSPILDEKNRSGAQTPAFSTDKVVIPAVSSGSVSKEVSNSPSRGKSPFMRVKLSPMVEAGSLNRSRSSINSRGLSSSGREDEWKQTQFKTIGGMKKINSNINKKPTFDTMLALQNHNRHSDVSNKSDPTTAHAMQTLEERKNEDSDSDFCSSSPEARPEITNVAAPLSDRQHRSNKSDPFLGTPRSDLSSNADMHELKMALGGQ